MEGQKNKTNGVNGILIVIIVILLGVIAFCAYKIGTMGRCVVDDTNLQKGGNTSVPVEEVTDDTKDVTTTNSGNVKSESADDRFKKYAENLKAARAKYKRSDDNNIQDGQEGYVYSWTNKLLSTVYLSSNGDLVVQTGNTKKVAEKNVLSFYIIGSGNGGFSYIYAIKEDSTVTNINIIGTDGNILSNFEVKQNISNLKNIVQVVQGAYSDGGGALYPIFIDIDGNAITPNYNHS